MKQFPDHPVIAKMERDGEPEPRGGYVLLCRECGAPVYEGEPYYDIDGRILCPDCVKAAKNYA